VERVSVKTGEREQMLDVTAEVRAAVRESGCRDGWALVYCPHTTAGVAVNEAADPHVAVDIVDGLRAFVPRDGSWRHREGNADAHVKATLVGESVTIPIEGGKLALGTWQGVFFCEFDGPRTRSLIVSCVPG
jgi:secondary thiamine-phosphate synthase enzyme